MKPIVSAIVAVLLAGCAALERVPVIIVVAEKDQRSRWESRVVGFRPNALTGQFEEIRREEIVQEYWVKSTDGRWYRVDEAPWRALSIGTVLEIP